MPRNYVSEPRLPFEPLAAFLDHADQRAIARMTGISRRSIVRYATRGIPLTRGDALAVGLGVHPSAIWSNWYERAGG